MMIHDYFLDVKRKMNRDDFIIYNVGFGESFAGYTYGYDSRDYYLLEYTLKGNGYLDLKNHIFALKKNDGFIVPPNTYFRTVNDTECFLCWIGFFSPHMEKVLEEARLLHQETPVFHFDNGALVESMIENIYHKARNPQVSNATIISQLYGLLGVLAERNLSVQANPVSLSYFEKANYYIGKNIFQKITVEQIVLEYDVSPAQLYRSFKENCGISPKQYIDLKKIEKACELILHTTLSFRQIANMLGYEHDTAFFRTFKRVKGIRPSEYKNSVL